MHVRIRKLTSITKDDDVVLKISKTALIRELQNMIYNKLNVEIEQQKLYYKGKQLISDHRIIDYDIKLNDVIQLLIKVNDEVKSNGKENDDPNVAKETKTEEPERLLQAESRYYENGDRIDVIDYNHGAWFEAKILNISTRKTQNAQESDLVFKIRMDRNVETAPIEVKFDDIRPRACYTYKHSELEPGMTVFVNYNIEQPTTRGYWYDFEIAEVTKKHIKGTLLMGKDHAGLENCTIKFVDEIMKIEKAVPLTARQDEKCEDIPLRKLPLYCNKCKDVPTKKCRECGCKICAKKDSDGILILCDECDSAYHLACLDPPLSEVPSDPEWYCPNCKTDESEIVRAGEKLKLSKKKMKMASNKEGGTSRDWGKGMACVGRSTECTIVPKNHYGPVPGVEVGTCWKFRVQVSEVGIHRPHVAGIHGRETDGAYSLVLSGGYEDDIDYGEEFYYTGSGGRDLSGNKRVSGQSCDQKLTRMNKYKSRICFDDFYNFEHFRALALNCNVKFNDVTGGEATDWRKGKPVRVVRNYKLRKHSKYAPVVGNRYDGIYKVVKYYPEKGKSGFIVWRYLLRRDDPVPPPWAQKDQEFDVICPPGHSEAEELEEELPKSKKKTKRKHQSSPDDSYSVSPKKSKLQAYKIDPETEKVILQDQINEKLWKECKEMLGEGRQKFLNKVEETFMCVCCQEILYEPITVTCKHNVCKSCLKRSFGAGIYVCPWCRFDLGKNFVMHVNGSLAKALKALFPGYEAGRQ
ncbi:E3 ubiquitin-protein ligase UHRF1 [Asbolus verrucosus]|uniref:RING-type E3 ubiquitin transferase n=1 Tax=Asbolus verrucosus TaxID=1661398 RepID=A0A482VZ65_ASBVE|nr:E3 ubiquitin-protein ligase UHRF1 [Asbolus verrucosus]